MLRYKADRRSIAFVATFFALVALQWWLEPTGWVFALGLVVTCTLSWFCAVITHNTVHHPVFYSRTLSGLFQMALTLSYGFPVSEYIPGHNLSHHRYTQTRRDVMRTTKVNFGWNLLNILAFFPRVALDVTAANYHYVSLMKGRRKRWYRQLVTEAVLTWSVKGVLLLVDWRKCLLYVFLPHVMAVWGITTVNYLQHDGCDAEHPYNHSRNFVGRFFNWFTFNNGFHGMHHMQPGLHWSRLREAHDRLLGPYIHPALDQRSLFFYLVSAFVWPGKRVTYDGRPVVVPSEGPDEEWVPLALRMERA